MSIGRDAEEIFHLRSGGPALCGVAAREEIVYPAPLRDDEF
jgi:hypothetical protein